MIHYPYRGKAICPGIGVRGGPLVLQDNIIYPGATINTSPDIDHRVKIRKVFRTHPTITFGTFHCCLHEYPYTKEAIKVPKNIFF